MNSILIIEDDKFLRDLLAKSLAEAGFEVGEAVNGSEGINEAKNKQFNAIVLDLLMPGIDGHEVIKELKADERTAKIPILVLSNLGGADTVKRVMDLGADDYLVKAHYTLEEVQKRIVEFVERRK